MQLYQEIYINLLNNLEAIRLARLQNTPNVVQIESAITSSKPVRPKPITNTGLAAVIGLLLAGGIAFSVEYLDDTVRTPDDIEQIFNLPTIGHIGNIKIGQGEVVDGHVMKHPRSPVSEAFRSLRTNLEFANVDHPLNKILVASSGPGEGKTTIATSLAAIIAQGGRKVLIIDADMRRPRIHSVFGISNRIGLSSLFRGNTTVRSTMRAVEGMDNLFVIPSGNLPPNPTELLASARMDEILAEAIIEVDVVVIDSPPSIVADYQVLSTKMDGVILVVQPGFTHIDAAMAMLEQLRRVNARILGVVLNKIHHNNHYYPYKRGEYYSNPSLEIQQPAPPVQNIQPEYRTQLPQAQSVQREPAKAPVPYFEFVLAPETEPQQQTIIDVEEKAPQPPVIYSPPQETPAHQNVATKPRQREQVIQSVNPAPVPQIKKDVQKPVFNEGNEYMIKSYKLEYWNDDDPENKGTK